jgi:concanavalin A-like lectin/glucanase superfamily protein
VSIYNRALLAGEIQSIYTAGSAGKCPPPPPPACVPPPSGLVSWWQAEGNALDSADGNNGTLIGNAAYAAGRVGQAFTFDGNGDAIFIGNPANLQLQNLTIEGWVKRSSATQVSSNPLFGEIVGYGPGGYVLGFQQDGSLFLSKNTVSYVQSVGTITNTAWHHVAVTKNGSTVVFYLDGAAEPVITYNTTFEFTTDLMIGAADNTVEASFLGMIDELSIYNRGLSAAEIQSIYNADGAGKCKLPDCSQQLAAVQAQLTAANAAVASLQTQLAACNNAVASDNQQNQDLQNEILGLLLPLQNLTHDWQIKFHRPSFQIPGATPVEQMQNLVAGIEDLHRLQQLGLLRELDHEAKKHKNDQH